MQRFSGTAAAHLKTKLAADDQVLADAQCVSQDAHGVRAPVHCLLQLVKPSGLQGNSHRLLELAVRKAPAGQGRNVGSLRTQASAGSAQDRCTVEVGYTC